MSEYEVKLRIDCVTKGWPSEGGMQRTGQVFCTTYCALLWYQSSLAS